MLRQEHSKVRISVQWIARQASRGFGLFSILAVIYCLSAHEPLATTTVAVSQRQVTCASKPFHQDRMPAQDSESPLPFDEQKAAEADWDIADGIDRHDARPILGSKPLLTSALWRWGPCYCATPRELLYSLQHLRI